MKTSQIHAAPRCGVLFSAACGVAIACTATAAIGQEMPAPEDMWRMIQAQQVEIEALKQRIGEQEGQTEETTQAIEAVVETMETQATGAGWWDRTQVGGYGELPL